MSLLQEVFYLQQKAKAEDAANTTAVHAEDALGAWCREVVVEGGVCASHVERR